MLLCILDYEKAFDCVRWESLWQVLSEKGDPGHLVALITSLYENNDAIVNLYNK